MPTAPTATCTGWPAPARSSTALGDRYAEEAARGRIAHGPGRAARHRPAGGSAGRRPSTTTCCCAPPPAPARPGPAGARPRDGRVVDPPGDGGAGRPAARRAAAGGPARRPGRHRLDPRRAGGLRRRRRPAHHHRPVAGARSTRSAWTCSASCRPRWLEIGRRALGESEFPAIAARLRSDPALRFRTSAEIVEVAEQALQRAAAGAGRAGSRTTTSRRASSSRSTRSRPRARRWRYYRPPAVDGSRPGAHVPAGQAPAGAVPVRVRGAGLPRVGARPPPAAGHRPDAGPAALPAAPRRRGVQLQRGLGALRRAAGRGDGPLQRRRRPARHAVVRRAAGLPAGHRHRRAPLRLVAGAGRGVRLAAHRHHARAHRQRGRPLHLLARSGAGLHDRPAGDRPAARALPARPWATGSTCVAFHGAVLGSGALPLGVLDQNIARWTAGVAGTAGPLEKEASAWT